MASGDVPAVPSSSDGDDMSTYMQSDATYDHSEATAVTGRCPSMFFPLFNDKLNTKPQYIPYTLSHLSTSWFCEMFINLLVMDFLFYTIQLPHPAVNASGDPSPFAKDQ